MQTHYSTFVPGWGKPSKSRSDPIQIRAIVAARSKADPMDLSKIWEQHLVAILTPIATEPFAAARQLAACIELLQENLPSWVRFPEDHGQWTSEQKLQRCWPRDFWALISAGTSEGAYIVSYVHGREDLGEHILRTLRPNTCEAPPPEMPERIRTSLEAGWQQRRAYGAPPSFIYVRNEWAERCTLVAPFKERIDPLIDLAREAVQRKGSDPSAILRLRDDPYLHTDTLAEALQCLPLAPSRTSPALPSGTAVRLTLDPTAHRGNAYHDSLPLRLEEERRHAEALHRMVDQQSASSEFINELRDLVHDSRLERDRDSTRDERPPRIPGTGGPASLGDGGPAKVLDAVYRAIEQAGKRVVEGAEEVPRKAVLQCLNGQDAKKAADYLAPSGRLCKGGWVQRDGEMVILTPKGAIEAMNRRQREERRRKG